MDLQKRITTKEYELSPDNLITFEFSEVLNEHGQYTLDLDGKVSAQRWEYGLPVGEPLSGTPAFMLKIFTDRENIPLGDKDFPYVTQKNKYYKKIRDFLGEKFKDRLKTKSGPNGTYFIGTPKPIKLIEPIEPAELRENKPVQAGCPLNGSSELHLVQTDEAKNVQYRLSLFSDSGSLFIYSNESESKENAKSYSVKENEWERIANIIAEYISFLYHTSPELVVITLHDKLTGKKCAPLDGYNYYDKEFRINFGISYITSIHLEFYDSAHLDVSNIMSLTFFKRGNSIFHAIPTNSALNDIGLDEETCIKLSMKLLEILNPNKKIIVGNSFEAKVYSDFSGGYKLHNLTK